MEATTVGLGDAGGIDDGDNMGLTPEPFPWDVSLLERGHSYDPVEMGLITGARPGTTEYQLRLLVVVKQLLDESARRGLNLPIRSKGALIRVMTDSEASDHYNRLSRKNLRGMNQQLLNMGSLVRTAPLTEEERDTHMRNTAILSMVVTAANSTLRSIEMGAAPPADPNRSAPQQPNWLQGQIEMIRGNIRVDPMSEAADPVSETDLEASLEDEDDQEETE